MFVMPPILPNRGIRPITIPDSQLMSRYINPRFDIDERLLYREPLRLKVTMTTATEIQQRMSEGMSALFQAQQAFADVQRCLLQRSRIEQLRNLVAHSRNNGAYSVELAWALAFEGMRQDLRRICPGYRG